MTIERGVIKKKVPPKEVVSLPVRVFWIKVESVNGETIVEGIPRTCFPTTLEGEFLTDQKKSFLNYLQNCLKEVDLPKDKEKSLNVKLLETLEKIKRLTTWCTNKSKSNSTEVTLWKVKDIKSREKGFEFVGLLPDFNTNHLNDSVQYLFELGATANKKHAYGLLAKYFECVGEIFLALVCEEIHFGKIELDCVREVFIKGEIAAFCGVKKPMVTVTDAFREIVQGRQQTREYANRANECWTAGNRILAMLFTELSCSLEMAPARKAFILHFLKDTSRKEWKDPTSLLKAAMQEASGQQVAVAVAVEAAEEEEEELGPKLQTIADRGHLKKLAQKDMAKIKLSVLEAILDHVSQGTLESIVNKRHKKGDLAYLLHAASGELLLPGDVIFVLHDDTNTLTCTKRKPAREELIFGRSVVARAGALMPYRVASPHGLNPKSAVEVVYLGHAFVKVHEQDQIEPGIWLCASKDGFAVPGGEMSSRVGKAIGCPILHDDNKWMVEAFVFIGRGENDMQLAELSSKFENLDVRMDGVEERLEKDQKFFEFLQRDMGEIKEDLRDLSQAQDSTQRHVAQLDQSVTAAHENIAVVDQKYAQYHANVTDTIARLTARVSDLEGNPSAEDDLNALRVELESMKDCQGVAAAQIQSLKDRLAKVADLVFKKELKATNQAAIGLDVNVNVPVEAAAAVLSSANDEGGTMEFQEKVDLDQSYIGRKVTIWK